MFDLIDEISKVHPEVFLEAAKELAVHAEENLAIDFLCENLREKQTRLSPQLLKKLQSVIEDRGLPLHWLNGL